MRREWGWGAYIEGGTLSPERGRQAPLSPVGGATAPPPAAEPRAAAVGDLFVNLFLQNRPVAPCLGDRGPVALPMGDRGSFLKFLGTAIYF